MYLQAHQEVQIDRLAHLLLDRLNQHVLFHEVLRGIRNFQARHSPLHPTNQFVGQVFLVWQLLELLCALFGFQDMLLRPGLCVLQCVHAKIPLRHVGFLLHLRCFAPVKDSWPKQCEIHVRLQFLRYRVQFQRRPSILHELEEPKWGHSSARS